MIWVGLLQAVLGLALIAYGDAKIDQYDVRHGIRSADGYGSNVSWVFPYNLMVGAGFVLAVSSPFTMMLKGFS